MNTANIVQKPWNDGNVLHDDRMICGDSIEAVPAHPRARRFRISCPSKNAQDRMRQ